MSPRELSPALCETLRLEAEEEEIEKEEYLHKDVENYDFEYA